MISHVVTAVALGTIEVLARPRSDKGVVYAADVLVVMARSCERGCMSVRILS